MRSALDFPTKGKVTHSATGTIVFQPRQSSYELHLNGDYTGAAGTPISAVIRAKARKLYTVSSGGNFTSPIQGPPRIIQGWVLYADETHLVIHAGANYIVEMPTDDAAISLDEGAIAVNRMVNVNLFPGAAFEVVGEPAVKD